MNKTKKVLLIVRDGWGYSAELENNMIAQAKTPYTDMLEETYPTFLLDASGESVGLPKGKFGNSEVGHMTLGAGRVLEQSLLRINHSIKDGSFFKNRSFLKAIDHVKKNNSHLHLMGLIQKEGVHSSFDHLVSLLQLAKNEGLAADQVHVHAISDGRDSSKKNAKKYLLELENVMKNLGIGKISSLSGRHFAMDRNENWKRTEKYYQMLLGASAQKFSCLGDYFDSLYKDDNFSDEFLEPVSSSFFEGISSGDAIIFSNFRKDRAKQIAKVFTEKNFNHFSSMQSLDSIYFCAMTEYFEGLENVAFPDLVVKNTLGEILEENNKTQLRIAETEKYAHVTFFFDGGIEKSFSGENRILIPSPDVHAFDERPEMGSLIIQDHILHEIKYSKPDFILCNLANADMVGHSGNHDATKRAVEYVDAVVSKIIPFALENNYSVLLTADHGNAEHKYGTHETSHTSNKVPLTIVGAEKTSYESPNTLADILGIVLKELKIASD